MRDTLATSKYSLHEFPSGPRALKLANEDEESKTSIKGIATAPQHHVQQQLDVNNDTSSRPNSQVQSEHACSDSNTEVEAPSKREDNGQDARKTFEVQWDGADDPTDPKNMSKLRKWIIVLILSAGSTCVTCTSSMYTSTYDQLTSEFHISRVVATVGLSLFVIGLGLAPLVLAPLSEFYGKLFSFPLQNGRLPKDQMGSRWQRPELSKE